LKSLVKSPGALLAPAMLAFVAACFVLPTGPAYALVFYAAVLPCLAARMTQAHLPTDSAFLCGVALIGWSGLTLLWGRDDGGRAAAMVLATFCTLGFWLALALSLDAEGTRHRLAVMLVVTGAANALASLVRYVVAPTYALPGQLKRLHGWGITYHPVLGAAVFSVCLLTALHLAIRDRRHRAWWLAACCILAGAILLTKSRGPALAATVASVCLLAAGPAWRWAAGSLVLLPLGLFSWRHGDSGHVDVWRLSLDEIAKRPWIGHGMAADLPGTLGADKRFPHDLYLSLLFYGGAVGLALFIGWAALLAARLVQTRRQPETVWIMALCANALIAGLTDFGQITKGPGPLWLIVWLPAALARQEGSISFLKKRNKKLLLSCPQ
jgi:hypothetical protein